MYSDVEVHIFEDALSSGVIIEFSRRRSIPEVQTYGEQTGSNYKSDHRVDRTGIPKTISLFLGKSSITKAIPKLPDVDRRPNSGFAM